MKTCLSLLFLIVQSALLFAQAPNDDCSGLIDLGVAPFGTASTIYNNIGATPSDIGNDNLPSCFAGTPMRDVWFQFTASDTITDYTIRIVGTAVDGTPTIYYPEFAIYRGPSCGFNTMALFACGSSSGSQDPTTAELDGVALTPGFTYYLRVNDFTSGVPQPGGFKVFVTPVRKPATVKDGRSEECYGTIYDSGGEAGNYQDNEDFSYTICPRTEHKCLVLHLEYYDMQFNDVQEDLYDLIRFYDGENLGSPQIAQIGKDDRFFTEGGVSNGGGVDYTVQAKSGCLTVRFTSDEEINLSGFKATWECLPDECKNQEPMKVKPEISNMELIENIARANMNISIDTIICNKLSYGTFQVDPDDFAIGEGIILSSGKITNAVGPNDGISLDDQSMGFPGDRNLDSLYGGTFDFGGEFFDILSEDACVVELDVFVPTDEVSFDYVVGSEEYPEFIDGTFNDIFAFLISGEGIEGDPKIDNQENLAVLPNSGLPIQISSVKPEANWKHFKSNEFYQNIFTNYTSAMEYDGFIVDEYAKKGYLTASKKVNPCQSYHLKFVVADRGDDIFDSAVFIARIGAGSPSLSIEYTSGLDYFVENCTPEPEFIEIEIPGYSEDTARYNLEVSGSAQLGVDFEADIPSEVVILPGQQIVRIPIRVLSDNEVEGTETVVVTLSKDYGCGEFTYDSITIEIRDAVATSIEAAMDTVLFCDGMPVTLMATGAEAYRWSPYQSFDDNLQPSVTLESSDGGWIYVEGRSGICTSTDSIYILKEAFDLSVNPVDPICPGTTIAIAATSNQDAVSYTWTDESGNELSQSDRVELEFSETQVITVEARLDNGCGSKTISTEVEVFPDFELGEMDVTDDQGQAIDLEALFSYGQILLTVDLPNTLDNATYKWFVNGDLVSTTSEPQSDLINTSAHAGSLNNVVRVEVTDANGCVQEQSLEIEIDNNLKIVFPNIFSPDGDGKNDRFRPVNRGSVAIDIVEFKVFNRWGNLVYDNTDGLEGWDGKYNGEDQPSGTYIYRISYRALSDQQLYNEVGEVNLLR